MRAVAIGLRAGMAAAIVDGADVLVAVGADVAADAVDAAAVVVVTAGAVDARAAVVAAEQDTRDFHHRFFADSRNETNLGCGESCSLFCWAETCHIWTRVARRAPVAAQA